ncbi:DUF1348 family protein [Streptomyces sp. NPDC056749]|uniref:DUF1348 family protein n=1 Tax=Streptomyces sp. NPDC056749 TaxID=3345936 RepID=UPI0036AA5DBF
MSSKQAGRPVAGAYAHSESGDRAVCQEPGGRPARGPGRSGDGRGERRALGEEHVCGSGFLRVSFVGRWYRCCGDENREFDGGGLTRSRHASIDDVPIDRGGRPPVPPAARPPPSRPPAGGGGRTTTRAHRAEPLSRSCPHARPYP